MFCFFVKNYFSDHDKFLYEEPTFFYIKKELIMKKEVFFYEEIHFLINLNHFNSYKFIF
jgi:hypothetical protein